MNIQVNELIWLNVERMFMYGCRSTSDLAILGWNLGTDVGQPMFLQFLVEIYVWM